MKVTDALYFASEAKALLKVLPQLRQARPPSLGEFFACGCVLQNRTLFPGHYTLTSRLVWTCAPGQAVRKEAYFDKQKWEHLPRSRNPEYYEKLKCDFCPRLATISRRNRKRKTRDLFDGRP